MIVFADNRSGAPGRGGTRWIVFGAAAGREAIAAGAAGGAVRVRSVMSGLRSLLSRHSGSNSRGARLSATWTGLRRGRRASAPPTSARSADACARPAPPTGAAGLALEAPVALARSVALDFALGRGLADRRKPVARALGLMLPLRQDALGLWPNLVERCRGKPFVDG